MWKKVWPVFTDNELLIDGIEIKLLTSSKNHQKFSKTIILNGIEDNR